MIVTTDTVSSHVTGELQPIAVHLHRSNPWGRKSRTSTFCSSKAIRFSVIFCCSWLMVWPRAAPRGGSQWAGCQRQMLGTKWFIMEKKSPFGEVVWVISTYLMYVELICMNKQVNNEYINKLRIKKYRHQPCQTTCGKSLKPPTAEGAGRKQARHIRLALKLHCPACHSSAGWSAANSSKLIGKANES